MYELQVVLVGTEYLTYASSQCQKLIKKKRLLQDPLLATNPGVLPGLKELIGMVASSVKS